MPYIHFASAFSEEIYLDESSHTILFHMVTFVPFVSTIDPNASMSRIGRCFLGQPLGITRTSCWNALFSRWNKRSVSGRKRRSIYPDRRFPFNRKCMSVDGSERKSTLPVNALHEAAKTCMVGGKPRRSSEPLSRFPHTYTACIFRGSAEMSHAPWKRFFFVFYSAI